jgi:hypothetical protein
MRGWFVSWGWSVVNRGWFIRWGWSVISGGFVYWLVGIITWFS